MVALLNLIDDIHALNHGAENRLVAVKAGLRREAYVELAAARFALRIDVIALARGGESATQMMLVLVDFRGHVIAGAAHSGAVGIAALHHEVGDDAMKR